jgi:peptidoglycan/xylan/chitin deacetylase (PgdA/CDA1 family)
VSTTAVVAGRNNNRAANASLIDVPILNYHKIDTLHHALSIPPQEFEEQMAYLSQRGFTTITPDQLMAYLNYGKALPEKPILITFDDGYLDNYTNAYPLMKKYGFTATIFIVTSLVGHDERFMSWDQVREMQKDGFVFGSHTVTHAALTKLSREQVMEELVASRKEMEQQLGGKPRYFAYPTGAYNLQIEEMVKQAGYKAAFTIRYGQAGAESNPYAHERIPIFKGPQTFRSFFVRLNAAPLLERFGLIRN